jgi:hypothetical protein
MVLAAVRLVVLVTGTTPVGVGITYRLAARTA